MWVSLHISDPFHIDSLETNTKHSKISGLITNNLPVLSVLSFLFILIGVDVCLTLQTRAWETRSAPVPVSPAPPVPRWSRRRRRTPTARSTGGRKAPATSKPMASLVLRKVTPSPPPSPHTFPTRVRPLNPTPPKLVWETKSHIKPYNSYLFTSKYLQMSQSFIFPSTSKRNWSTSVCTLHVHPNISYLSKYLYTLFFFCWYLCTYIMIWIFFNSFSQNINLKTSLHYIIQKFHFLHYWSFTSCFKSLVCFFI